MRFLQKPLDSGDHAARIFGFPPVGEELLALTGGTKLAIENMAAVQTGSFHLPLVGFGEINSPAAADLLPFGKVRRKLLRDLNTDFVTAVANTRAYSRIDISGSRAEISRHFFNRAANDGGCRSAPSRMNSAYGPLAAIEQQNGHAIGGTNADASACFVRHQGIAFAFAVMQTVSIEHMIRVNLTESHTRLGAAGPRAEAMFLPDKLLKRITAVDPVRPEPKRVVHEFEL